MRRTKENLKNLKEPEPEEPDEPEVSVSLIDDFNLQQYFFFSAVGKSCLLLQFTDKRFQPVHDLTIGLWLARVTLLSIRY